MSPRYKKTVWVTILVLVLSAAAVCFTAAARKKKPAARSIPASATDESDIHGLVFAIRPTGFEPAEVEVAKGAYLFIVQNRSGIRDLDFRLDRQAGEKLHEVRDQRAQWKKQFDLKPGTYVLSIVDHPEWRSVITVNSH